VCHLHNLPANISRRAIMPMLSKAVVLAALGVAHGLSSQEATSIVSSLLQTLTQSDRTNMAAGMQSLQQVLMYSSVAITPEAAKGINEIAAKIPGTILPEVKKAHSKTQQAIDTAAEILVTSFQAAEVAKRAGNEADTQLSGCYAEEKEALIALEQKQGALNSQTTATNAHCATVNTTESKMMTMTEWSNLMDLDCRIDKGCVAAQESWSKDMTGYLAEVKKQTQAKVTAWNARHSKCTEMQGVMSTLTREEASLSGAYSQKRQSCAAQKQTTENAICSFKKAWDTKCADVIAYDGLIQKATGADLENIHSDKARRNEWYLSTISKCLIDDYSAGKDVNEVTLSACQQSVNYNQDVGVIDSKTSEVSSSKSGLMCSSTRYGFSNKIWQIPTSDMKSADYKMSTGNHAVSSMCSDAPVAAPVVCADEDCECKMNNDANYCAEPAQVCMKPCYNR